MTDARQRLDRNLKRMLGNTSSLIKVYRDDEIVDHLLWIRIDDKNLKTSTELKGFIEDASHAKLVAAGFGVVCNVTPQKTVTTIISW